MKLKNFLIGGDQNSIKKLEIFISIIIIGYFGIKIVYGSFFGFYPEKYYYKNVSITTNENNITNTENITLNALIPGMWNNEMVDLITLLVLAFVIYVYTNLSEKSYINEFGNLNLSFLFGYIIGLGYPAIYTNYKSLLSKELQSSNMIKYIYLLIFVVFIIFITIINYTSINPADTPHRISYAIYVIVIVLLLFGLILSRKKSKSFNSVTYFYNNGENCSFNKNGVLQTSGDIVNITVPFMVFILLLLFSYEPSEITMKNLYIFVYGLLLGILVSTVSYYGIEYFLQKNPEKQCNDKNECILKEMPTPVITQDPSLNIPNIPSQTTTPDTNYNNRMSKLNIVLIIFIVLIIAYLIYMFFV